MSRSFKKNAILKDGGKSHKYEKKLSSSKIRANVRTILTTTDDYENILFPDERAKDIINAYNICDNWWHSDVINRIHIWISSYTGKRYVDKPTEADFRMYKNK